MSNHAKSTAVYGGLLVALLAASWWKWTSDPELELDGQVVLLQGEEAGLEKIVWNAKDKDRAEIVRRSDEAGDFLWVTHTRWTADKPADVPPTEAPATQESGEAEGAKQADGTTAEPDAAPAEGTADSVEPTYTAEVQVFKAGEAGDELLESLSPMLAIRKLDSVDAEKLETIGLSEPTDTLEVTRKGRTVVLELGGEVYGTRDRYVRQQDSGEIFLVDDEVLRPLKYARTRLPNRDLWDFERKDIQRVVITDDSGASATFAQRNADDETKSFWVPDAAAEEAEKNAQLDTWMDKALKMRGTRYSDPDEADEIYAPAFTLAFALEDGSTLELKVEKDASEGDFWASSPFTRGRMKLLRTATEALADDVSTIIEQVPAG